MAVEETKADPFQITARRIVYENAWITVEHQDVVRPDGKPGIYGIVRFANRAVGVLPIDDQGYVWLVGQYRRPLAAWSWEMPEGGVPHDEDLMAGARRELEEETGLRAAHLIRVLDLDLSNSVSDETATCFVAYGLSQGLAAPEGTEILSQRRIHFSKLMEEVVTGEIRDSLTVATVYRTYHLVHTNQLPVVLSQAMLAMPEGD
ncbi:ADP-ribose pyrophosphatase [Candidatus Phycosocius bacilliformis]|uniref:GDP-mannose pyrophosphatase n=1 Tax=Candidatus Phycosocius bacilliformis TaxID=1445552 RepID=A0A2P2ECL4_9PROT|nr:NUDIX hydrolase [Candidatus Phycosocius bacilliformis]GBF58805.1 ADP-ribose pyrophosphatase [Candidatus Phycosocius bacilliformis]